MAKSKQETQVSSAQSAMDALNAEYGVGTIMKMTDPGVKGVTAISSGSLLLNDALGIGGYGKGRIIEIYGGESTGKTTLSLHFLAQFNGQPTLFIDAEHALDVEYAKTLGVDVNNMIIAQPDYIEQGLDILDKMCSSVSAVVFDSIAGSPPKKELEGEMTDEDIGIKAKRMSRALRMMNGKISQNETTVMFINQIREKIGLFAGKTRPGGYALKFHASQSLELWTVAADKIESGGEQIGHYVTVKIGKNKLAPPFKVCKLPIIYGQGISKEMEVIDLAVAADIISKKGSWYSYGDAKLAQGATACREFLEDNPDLMGEIVQKLDI